MTFSGLNPFQIRVVIQTKQLRTEVILNRVSIPFRSGQSFRRAIERLRNRLDLSQSLSDQGSHSDFHLINNLTGEHRLNPFQIRVVIQTYVDGSKLRVDNRLNPFQIRVVIQTGERALDHRERVVSIPFRSG